MLEECVNWCRLCAKENGNNIDVLFRDEIINNLSDTLEKYFSITVSPTDGMSTSICYECHKNIAEILMFANRIKNVQLMLSELKFCCEMKTLSVDLVALRRQFGIENDEDKRFCDQIIDTSFLDRYNNMGDSSCFSEVMIDETSDIEYTRNNNTLIKSDNDLIEHSDITEVDYLDEDNFQFKYDSDFGNPIDELIQEKFKFNVAVEDNHNITKKTPLLQIDEQFDEDGDYQCDICRKMFKRKTNYQYHMKSRHSTIEKNVKFNCSKCTKTFTSKKRCKNHELTHLVSKMKILYSCPFCDEKFTKKVTVQMHVRTVHENDKPYICDDCGKAFSTCGALKEHKYIHIKETPYHCTKCPKRFKNKARLKTHSDTHNDTLYVCNICGLQLNTKRTLLMHMVVHSDQKNHKCNFCGNEYKRGKTLKNHLILHTGLRPYACPFCDKTFANGSNCRSHKKKVHPNELAELETAVSPSTNTHIPKIEHLKDETYDFQKPARRQTRDDESTFSLSNDSSELLSLSLTESSIPEHPYYDHFELELP